MNLQLSCGLAMLLGMAPIAHSLPPQNVLFIVIDDLRAELPMYGAAHVHTANLQSLVRLLWLIWIWNTLQTATPLNHSSECYCASKPIWVVHLQLVTDTACTAVACFSLSPFTIPYHLHPSCSPTTHQADDSLIFDRAYCNQPVCSPSRNSFMSGRRPSTTKIWNFISSFRQQGPNWVTLYVIIKG